MMQRTEIPAASATRLQLLPNLLPIVTAATTMLAALCPIGAAHAQGEADSGQKLFMQNGCFVCHGQDGFGGVGPAFRNDPFLKLTDYVAGQILIGRGVMPPYGNKLDDQQIADVATYIRNSWGNHFGAVKPEQVAEVRRELGGAGQQATSPSGQTTGSAPQGGGSKAPRSTGNGQNRNNPPK